jgi:hypothetical protein
MVPAGQTSSVAPSARDHGDGVTRQGDSIGRVTSQHCRYEGAAAGILFDRDAGPVILGLFALLTRGKTVVIRSAP